jgi:hypothetical protein
MRAIGSWLTPILFCGKRCCKPSALANRQDTPCLGHRMHGLKVTARAALHKVWNYGARLASRPINITRFISLSWLTDAASKLWDSRRPTIPFKSLASTDSLYWKRHKTWQNSMCVSRLASHLILFAERIVRSSPSGTYSEKQACDKI